MAKSSVGNSKFLSFDMRSRGKSGVQNKQELFASEYLVRDLHKTEEIDVLKAMHHGHRLLKLCSRRSRSHWRTFKLDPTNSYIRWVSDKKDVEATTIFIHDIVEIISHSKQVVDKFKDTLPEELNINPTDLVQQQFTIRYVDHDKKYHHYLPQLSPNHSLTNNVVNNRNHHHVNGHSLSIIHSNNNSNDINLPSIHGVNMQSNSFRFKKNPISIMQPQVESNENSRIDESVTDSGSNNYKKTNKSLKSSSLKSSIWKNLFTKTSKQNKKNKAHPTIVEENSDDINGENNDDLLVNTHQRNHSANNNNHVQELHLMAEKKKSAMIWIYGLEQLINKLKDGGDSAEIKSLKIATKELMEYNTIIFGGIGGDFNEDDKFYGFDKIRKFNAHLKSTRNGLNNIIDQLPIWQRELLEQKNDQSLGVYTKNNPDDIMMQKLRKDLNEIEEIINETQKTIHIKRLYNKEKLKKWNYKLSRIDIDIGGFQIAINNQKKLEQSHYRLHNMETTIGSNNNNRHRRQRSKSSSTYSMNYHNHGYFLSNPQNRRSSRDSAHSQNLILKNRTPRSNYNANGAINESQENNDDPLNIITPSLPLNTMEKFDSV